MVGVRMVFQGKYRFAAWDKSRIIMKTDGSLDVLAEKGGGVPVSESGMDDRFNLYGMHKNETVIQAMNGNYISWTPRFCYQTAQEDKQEHILEHTFPYLKGMHFPPVKHYS